jgi:hypothetical protein
MPTDDKSTQGADGSTGTPPAPQDGQNAQAHSEQPLFDARKAFDAVNKRMNDLGSKLEKFDPEIIAQVAEKLGVSKKEAEKQMEAQTPDARQIAREELWNDKHADRIAEANKDGAYDAYLKQGIKPDLALRLAEQDQGIQVDTSEQKRQLKISSADAQVDRSGPAPGPYKSGEFGLTDADIQKYGDKAQQVKVFR